MDMLGNICFNHLKLHMLEAMTLQEALEEFHLEASPWSHLGTKKDLQAIGCLVVLVVYIVKFPLETWNPEKKLWKRMDFCIWDLTENVWKYVLFRLELLGVNHKWAASHWELFPENLPRCWRSLAAPARVVTVFACWPAMLRNEKDKKIKKHSAMIDHVIIQVSSAISSHHLIFRPSLGRLNALCIWEQPSGHERCVAIWLFPRRWLKETCGCGVIDLLILAGMNISRTRVVFSPCEMIILWCSGW